MRLPQLLWNQYSSSKMRSWQKDSKKGSSKQVQRGQMQLTHRTLLLRQLQLLVNMISRSLQL
jgi:hypothetical protein